MLHCAGFGCNFQSEGNKRSDVSLHSFPTGKKRRKQWEGACRRTQLPKDPRLCSQHFSPDVFEIRWKVNALPTIFPHKEPKPDNPLLPLLSCWANHLVTDEAEHSPLPSVKQAVIVAIQCSPKCIATLTTMVTYELNKFYKNEDIKKVFYTTLI
uniref:THAP-type domain-containing protein n=1 Tax=Nothobranchius furzeri TaxID=105023 RepID=A0A8C6PE97_NOTFU